MTTPTANPVPSSSPVDLLFNAEKLDEIVNSEALSYLDRFGVPRLTALGAVESIKSINPRGAWAASTNYASKDVVLVSGTWYIAVQSHTSSAAFATDAAKWRVYQGVLASDLGAPAGAGIVGFSQSGAGAVARTALAKLRERVTVWDFGSIGDGTYHPLSERFATLVDAQAVYSFAVALSDSIDWAALQAGINFAAGKRVLDISGGTFIINRQVNLITGTTIAGNGTIKLKDNCLPRLSSLVFCNTASDVHLSDIVIDGNRENNIDHGTPDASGNQDKGWQGTLLALLNTAFMSDFSFRNVTVKNAWGSAVWLTDCSDGVVEGCTVIDYRITGIALRNFSGDPRLVKNVRVLDNRVEGGIVGIHTIFGAFDAVIDGNTCNGNRDPSRFPSWAYSGTYPNVWPSTGDFKQFGETGYVAPALVGDGAGIEATGSFTDPGSPSNFSIAVSNNSCAQNAVGVRLEEMSTGFSVNGNTCRNNDFYGILMFAAYFNTAVGNSCLNNGYDGIRVEKTIGKPKASNNVIVGNICLTNGRFGVCIVASDGTIIEGNNLSGNGASAGFAERGPIGLFSFDGAHVTGSLINGNSLGNYYGTDAYGIYSNSALNAGNLFHGNFFSGAYGVAKVFGLNTTDNKFTRNLGYQTEGSGPATVIAGSTFVDVAHGMAYTPDLNSVRVSPITDTGALRWWVESVDATTIRIRMNAAPGANVSFGWSVAP